MPSVRTLSLPVAACVMWLAILCSPVGTAAASAPASSPATSGLQCAAMSPAQIEATPSPGDPCWVDSDGPAQGESASGAEQQGNPQYPFGIDGSAVDPESQVCTGGVTRGYGIEDRGNGWLGDVEATPSCYLQVTSLAFRAWNRGLAATALDGGNGNSTTENAYGVWLYNGAEWFPDPTFPGSSTCPGSTILWAGKLDYWLIGSSEGTPLTKSFSGGSGPTTTLCHFDGENLYWQAMTLPSATLADLPLTSQGRVGGVTSGTCTAWNNCWFFGTNGIRVHWDGEELSDASDLISDRPWMQGNAVSASGNLSSSGQETGIVLNDDQTDDCTNYPCALPTQPDGSVAPQALDYDGSSWGPLALPQTLSGALANPYQPTDFSQVAQDASGDTWLTAEPANEALRGTGAQAVPLIRVDSGLNPICSDTQNTTEYNNLQQLGLDWTTAAVAPDGSVLAGGGDYYFDTTMPADPSSPFATQPQPELVTGSCAGGSGGAQFNTLTFTTPTPTGGSGAEPADQTAEVTAVAAPAINDEWAATGTGSWNAAQTANCPGNAPFCVRTQTMAPHLYQYTDSQTPDAPAGDDNESRPSLFTLSPPILQVSAATIIAAPITTTIRKKGKRKQIKLPPAIYALHTHLIHAGKRYTLQLLFRVRRPVTVGLAVLHHGRIVARTPLERFKGHKGILAVRLNTHAWPTGLKLLSPPTHKDKH